MSSCRMRSLALTLSLASVPAIVAMQAPAAPGTRGNPGIGRIRAETWPTPGYSALDQITRSNVGRLAGAWTASLDGPLRATPVVGGRLMFVPTRTQIVAFDAGTGNVVWRYRPTTPFSSGLKGLTLGMVLCSRDSRTRP